MISLAIDMRISMCAFETSGILSMTCQRLLMRLNVAPAKSQKGVKGMGLRYPVPTWRVEFDVVKRQSVGAHYSLFSIANILNTWAKRINKLLVHQHLNCKTMQQTGDALPKYSSRLFDEATRGDTRWWIGSSWNITFLRGCTMCIYSKGVARSHSNAPLLDSNTIMHSLAAIVAKQSVPRSPTDENAYYVLYLPFLASADTKYRMARTHVNKNEQFSLQRKSAFIKCKIRDSVHFFLFPNSKLLIEIANYEIKIEITNWNC